MSSHTSDLKKLVLQWLPCHNSSVLQATGVSYSNLSLLTQFLLQLSPPGDWCVILRPVLAHTVPVTTPLSSRRLLCHTQTCPCSHSSCYNSLLQATGVSYSDLSLLTQFLSQLLCPPGDCCVILRPVLAHTVPVTTPLFSRRLVCHTQTCPCSHSSCYNSFLQTTAVSYSDLSLLTQFLSQLLCPPGDCCVMLRPVHAHTVPVTTPLSSRRLLCHAQTCPCSHSSCHNSSVLQATAVSCSDLSLLTQFLSQLLCPPGDCCVMLRPVHAHTVPVTTPLSSRRLLCHAQTCPCSHSSCHNSSVLQATAVSCSDLSLLTQFLSQLLCPPGDCCVMLRPVLAHTVPVTTPLSSRRLLCHAWTCPCSHSSSFTPHCHSCPVVKASTS